MKKRRVTRHIALALLVGALWCLGPLPRCEEGAPSESERGEALRDALAVQVLHRQARSPGGALISGSRREALDEALFALTGEEFLLEAWGALVGGARVACLVLPGAEPLADALEARARNAQPAPASLRRVATASEITEGERVIVIAAPAWREGKAEPALRDLAARVEDLSGEAPRAFLLDLFESRVEGASHEIDMLLAAERPEAASLLVEYVLSARASGSIPPLDALFARHGVERESVRWYRLALPYDER